MPRHALSKRTKTPHNHSCFGILVCTCIVHLHPQGRCRAMLLSHLFCLQSTCCHVASCTQIGGIGRSKKIHHLVHYVPRTHYRTRYSPWNSSWFYEVPWCNCCPTAWGCHCCTGWIMVQRTNQDGHYLIRPLDVLSGSLFWSLILSANCIEFQTVYYFMRSRVKRWVPSWKGCGIWSKLVKKYHFDPIPFVCLLNCLYSPKNSGRLLIIASDM